MIAQNELFRAVAVVTLFWYIGLFVISSLHGTAPWHVVYVLPQSVLISGAGALGGFAVSMFYLASERGFKGHEIHQGSIMWNARLSMGLPFTVRGPERGRGKSADAALANQRWWRAVSTSSPAYANAIRAVVETMLAEPRLPASPYPGGHGGRTLLDHSFAVATEMLRQAPAWVYEGQRDKRGNIRVPLADGNEPHRFTAAEGPLLILAGLAHDIGKMACYQPIPNQDRSAKAKGTLRVTEIKPLHDIEGARLLRRLPEIMALPMADRTALLMAINYYHHPFGLPSSGWLHDRVRSLTELLAHTDIEVGKAEGHTLVDHHEHAESEEGGIVEAVDPNALLAGANLTERDIEDADADLAALVAAIGTPSPAQQAPSAAPRTAATAAAASPSTSPAMRADETAPLELRLFMTAIRKQGAINGRDRACRIAWKHAGNVYVMDKVMRSLIHNQGGADPIWAATAMAESNGNASPFTAALAQQLRDRGALVTEFEGMEFAPARALFRMKMPSGTSIPVLIVRAASIPGADGIRDSEKPVDIIGPLWGERSARNKPKSSASTPERAESDVEVQPDPIEQPDRTVSMREVDYDDLSGTPTPPPAASIPAAASSFDDDDLPFALPDLPSQTAETEAEPEQSDAADAQGVDVLEMITEIILSADFVSKHPYQVRTRDDVRRALLPLDSSAGQAVTRAVDKLRDAGQDVSSITIGRLQETDERAYVFVIP